MKPIESRQNTEEPLQQQPTTAMGLVAGAVMELCKHADETLEAHVVQGQLVYSGVTRDPRSKRHS